MQELSHVNVLQVFPAMCLQAKQLGFVLLIENGEFSLGTHDSVACVLRSESLNDIGMWLRGYEHAKEKK